MVVSQKFVWAHIPKTGGDATATMIQQVPRLVVLADHLDDNAKHLALDQRAGSINGKLLVANIRRLPDWAFSLMRHRARFGRAPAYEPEGFQTPEAVAAEPAADHALDQIVGRHEIDFWIRQENLTEDLLTFLRRVTTLTPEEERAITSIGRVNEGPRAWRPRLRTPARFFGPEHIEALYANNPRWAAVERQVYG